MLCKHITRLLCNDHSILYDRVQKTAMEQVVSYLQKTTISLLLSELNQAELLLEKAQREAKKAKKNLEKAIVRR